MYQNIVRDWKEWGKELEPNKSVRVSHSCADDRSMIVSRTESGVSAYCHRCGKVGWLPPAPETTAEKIARIMRQREGDATVGGGSLPSPQNRDMDSWPEGGKLWLYRAGLSRADVGVLGIYWHEKSDRIVIPVRCADGQLFYVARAHQKDRQPKYLAMAPKPRTLYASWGHASSVCLTEDILSAIKIGLAGEEAVCLFGTKISDHIMSRIMSRTVNVFLDPDPPGQRGAAKIMAQLRAYGVPCRNIVADRDPKLLTRTQLKEILA